MPLTLEERRYKRQRMIIITKQLEDKYQSVINVPEDEPLLRKLHNLVTLGEDRKYHKTKPKIKVKVKKQYICRNPREPYKDRDELKEQAIKLAQKGYLNKEISEKLNISASTIGDWIPKDTVRPPIFNKLLVDLIKHEMIYFKNAKEAKEWCANNGISYYSAFRGINYRFEIETVHLHWDDINNGALYVMDNGTVYEKVKHKYTEEDKQLSSYRV